MDQLARAGNLLPNLRNKFPPGNDSGQHVQNLPGLLCPPPEPIICPIPKPIQLECPIPAVQDAPMLTSPKRKEQKIISNLRDLGIVVIFKTGAQEVSQLAIHLGTTLRYFEETDILFFSDNEGTIGPFVINDALKNVDQKIRETHPDFRIYRYIHRYQATGQDITDLKEDKSKGEGRGGWRLDKYKFIHMVEQAFLQRPAAKWYVFIETDSYVVWPNLIEWLKKLDSTKPLYLGAALLMGSTYFAHGGSGYVLSNAAMNKLLGPEQPRELATSWDTRMDEECCGDVALGKALMEKGVKLTQAHPLTNGYKPSTFTYGPNDHWCQPVVTMHHLVPHEISSVWRFERQREMLSNDLNATIFSELFFHFVEPHLTESRDNWDNLSHGPTYTEPTEVQEARWKKEKEERKAADKKLEDGKDNAPLTKAKPKHSKRKREGSDQLPKLSDVEKEAYKSFENCAEACKENNECFQWVHYYYTCRLQTSFRLGHYQAPLLDGKIVYRSGWMVDKINKWTAENTCKEPQWD